MCSHAVGKFYKTQSSGKEDNKSTPVPSQAKEPPQDEALSTKRSVASKLQIIYISVLTTVLLQRQKKLITFARLCT